MSNKLLSLSRHWAPELTDGLPDCRVKDDARRELTTIKRGKITYERVWCANCGCSGGAVPEETTPWVFYVCNECVRLLGNPEGCFELPEDFVRNPSQSRIDVTAPRWMGKRKRDE